MSSIESRKFRTDIQGLRAIAVLLVLLYHSGVSVLSGGFVGVDVFFVISGFLITMHLLEQLDTGRLRLREFWARRVRRLVPAAWTVGAVSLLVGLLWFPRLSLPQLLRDAAAAFAYVPNVLFARQGTNYLANDMPSVYQHYWSLGIEEQFYLLWPIVLFFGWRLCGGSRRLLFGIVAVLTLGSLILGIWMTEWRQPWAFFLLPFRGWELGVGALLAFLVLMMPRLQASHPWKSAVGWAGVLLILGSALLMDSSTPFPGWQATVPVLGAASVILAGVGTTHERAPAVFLSLAPMQFFGRISYSLYLVHWPLLIIPQTIVGWQDPLPLPVNLGLGLLAVPVAWLCWRFIEQAGQSPSRWWYGKAWRPLLVAVSGASVVVALAWPAASWVAKQPIASARAAEAMERTPYPVGTGYVPSNMQPALISAADDYAHEPGCHLGNDEVVPGDCRFGENAAAPLVVLFGDSHAHHWQPALVELAAQGKIQLQVHTKNWCTTADMEAYRWGVSYPECTAWRNAVIEQINQEKPALVLFGNKSAYHREYVDDWEGALARGVERVGPEVRTAIIEAVGIRTSDPQLCLSQYVEHAEVCSESRADVVDEVSLRADRAAAEASGAQLIEVNDFLCTENVCPLIIGNTLVYRDTNHLTATFSRSMASVFEAAITATLE